MDMSRVTEKNTPEGEKLQPAVPIKKSIAPDYIICLEDGKKLKMLRRHLKTSYGMIFRLGQDAGDDPPLAGHFEATFDA